MTRFDEAFGPLCWQIEFVEWRAKGVKARLSVWNPDLKQWIFREDSADQTDIEPTKGGFSDALKRVAVQFGLGRCLYDYPMIQLKGEFKYIPDWAFKQLNDIVRSQNAGTNNRQYYELSAPADREKTIVEKPVRSAGAVDTAAKTTPITPSPLAAPPAEEQRSASSAGGDPEDAHLRALIDNAAQLDSMDAWLAFADANFDSQGLEGFDIAMTQAKERIYAQVQKVRI